MDENEFYGRVQERGQLTSTDEAQVATEAVLETLGETLTGGEAEDVARQLPTAFQDAIGRSDHDGAGYDRDAFVNAVGERLRGTDLDQSNADAHAQAVTDAVAASLTDGELDDLTAQLNDDLVPLFENVSANRGG